MEFVPGQTLADRVLEGPLSINEALLIGQQIALALEAAHAEGIIHRDLKPANVKITPAGKVKVLDFGLAKAVRVHADADHPTVVEATRQGVILGTPAYMSPEQVRGQPLDKRTDVWSFGCVLYEMLSGKRAFPAATVADTYIAVVEREPDWTLLPLSTPSSIQDSLRRCLRKDASRRLCDIGDLSLVIEEAGGKTDKAAPLPESMMPSALHSTQAQPGISLTTPGIESPTMAPQFGHLQRAVFITRLKQLLRLHKNSPDLAASCFLALLCLFCCVFFGYVVGHLLGGGGLGTAGGGVLGLLAAVLVNWLSNGMGRIQRRRAIERKSA
jgi:serine/threonine protein kinase